MSKFSTFIDGDDCRDCMEYEKERIELNSRIWQLKEALREILDKYEQDYCKWTIDVCEKALGGDK